ncbi:MAG: hypothetical protein ACI8UO_002041 [Verrucomicrobiales bacterium]|jgi:hypothetical protein
MTKFSSALKLLTCCVAVPALAENPDKSQFNLFNPVPEGQLREIIGDRPDRTESPTTVDAGHIQIEASFADFAHDKSGGTEFSAITAGATNLRIGLLSDLELQVLFDVWTREEIGVRGLPEEVTEGFSDITLRPKLNIWGNDGGSTALAIMPAVKIPTGSKLSVEEIEGSIIVPFGMDLTERFGLGLMAEVDWVYDEEDRGYETEFVHTAVLGYDLNDKIGIYAEYIGVSGSNNYQPYFSGGMTLGVSENAVFDLGAVVGLNEDANDIQIFTGITVRF